MATYLIPYGGVNKIGGNALLVEGNGGRILLDLGKDFEQFSRYFEFPYTLPSRSVERELIRTGVIPLLRDSKGKELHLFAEFEGEVKEPRGDPPLDAIAISHAHLDHCGLLPFVRSDAKILMGRMGKLLFEALHEIRRDASLEEKMYWGSGRKEEHVPRIRIEAFSSSSRLQIGPFRLRPNPVDHSIPGAYGFILDTPDGRVAYTGDFRLHGPAAELSQRFLKELAKEPLEVLICEGTNIDMGRTGGEEQVRQDAEALITQHFKARGKLVIIEIRSTDLDRLATFLRIGEELDCTIVAAPRIAYLLKRIEDEGLLGSLISWKDLKRGPLCKGKMRVLDRGKSRPDAWERELLKGSEVLSLEEVREPKRRMMLLEAGHPNIFELNPPPGTLYIQSTSEHVNEEEEFGEERFINALSLHGLLLYRLHSSGHVGPLELLSFIEEAKPKRLIPIHTNHPETLAEIMRGRMNVILPEKGIPIPLAP